jgi:hypothetical protein
MSSRTLTPIVHRLFFLLQTQRITRRAPSPRRTHSHTRTTTTSTSTRGQAQWIPLCRRPTSRCTRHVFKRVSAFTNHVAPCAGCVCYTDEASVQISGSHSSSRVVKEKRGRVDISLPRPRTLSSTRDSVPSRCHYCTCSFAHACSCGRRCA